MASLIKRINLKIVIVLFLFLNSCTEKSELSKEEIKIKKDLVLFSDKIQTMNIKTIKSLMHDQTAQAYFLDHKKNVNKQFVNNLVSIIKNEEYVIKIFDDSSFVLKAGRVNKDIGTNAFSKGFYFFIETKDTLKFWKKGVWK